MLLSLIFIIVVVDIIFIVAIIVVVVVIILFQVLDDPSGNSFVENTIASKENPNLRVEHYTRTAQQDAELGIISATQSEVSVLV